MTEQAMPNPVKLYETATKATQQLIASVKPDQLESATPCSEWDVKAIIDHLIGGAAFFSASLAGEEPSGPPQADSPAEAYGILTSKVVEVASIPSNLERRVPTPFGEMSGGEVIFGAFMDTVVHGWDLAKATGQDTSLNADHVEIISQAFGPQMDGLRQGGAFGPEVLVGSEVSSQDKLLSMMGRQP